MSVQGGLESREPYNPILEVSIGYAGVAAVAVIDEVTFENERQDERMEGIEEGVLDLMARVLSVEEENRQLREVNRNLEEHVGREGEWIRFLERAVRMLRMLINSLVKMVGLVSGPLYPKLSTCFEGTRLTQLVQLVTAGRLFPCHEGS